MRAGISRTKCAAQAVARGVRAASSPAEREQRADRGGGVIWARKAEGVADEAIGGELSCHKGPSQISFWHKAKYLLGTRKVHVLL